MGRRIVNSGGKWTGQTPKMSQHVCISWYTGMMITNPINTQLCSMNYLKVGLSTVEHTRQRRGGNCAVHVSQESMTTTIRPQLPVSIVQVDGVQNQQTTPVLNASRVTTARAVAP